MANLNFLNPATIVEAHARRESGQGFAAVVDEIKKSHGRPLQGDPLRKRTAEDRAKDPNADDAFDMEKDDMDEDEDEDACATGTEASDVEARRKLRQKADKKRNARPPLEATAKMIKAVHAKGARAEDPEWRDVAANTRVEYRDNRLSTQRIRKAQRQPMTLTQLFNTTNNNHAIDEAAIQRIVEQGRLTLQKRDGIPSDEWNRMTPRERVEAVARVFGKTDSTIRFSSKPNFPPNSQNQSLDNQPWADTGNTNATTNRDQPTPSQPFAGGHEGGFTDSAVPQSDPRIRAAVLLGSSGDAEGRDAALVKIKEALRRPLRMWS